MDNGEKIIRYNIIQLSTLYSRENLKGTALTKIDFIHHVAL